MLLCFSKGANNLSPSSQLNIHDYWTVRYKPIPNVDFIPAFVSTLVEISLTPSQKRATVIRVI